MEVEALGDPDAGGNEDAYCVGIVVMMRELVKYADGLKAGKVVITNEIRLIQIIDAAVVKEAGRFCGDFSAARRLVTIAAEDPVEEKVDQELTYL